jgi:hypothetical protein
MKFGIGGIQLADENMKLKELLPTVIYVLKGMVIW